MKPARLGVSTYDYRRWQSGARRAANMRKIAGARRLRRRRYNYPSLKAEPKFYDTFRTTFTLASSATFAGCEYDPSATSMISTPSVGDSEQNRDGKKIVITQVEVKGWVYKYTEANQTTAEDGQWAWIALVLDTQTNGVQMNSEDCFKNIEGANAALAVPFRNLLYGGRFRILKFKRFVFNNPNLCWDGTNMEQNGMVRPFKFYKKLRLPVNFNAGTTSDIANVIDNSLHIIGCSSQASNITASYGARIRFIG